MRNFRRKMIQFEIVYKNILFSIMYPLVAGGIRFIMRRNGIQYLTNKFFYYFLHLPDTIVWEILIGAILCLGMVYELFCLDRIYGLAEAKRPVRLYSVCKNALEEMKKIIKPGNILLVLYCLCLFLFMNAVVFYDSISRSKLVSILLQNAKIPGHARLILLLSLLVLFVLVFLGFYSIRFFLNGEGSFLHCYGKSVSIAWENKWNIIWRMVLVNIFAMLVYGGLYVCLSIIVIAGVWLFNMNHMGVAIYLTTIRLFNQGMHLFLTAMSIPVTYMIVFRQFQKQEDVKKRVFTEEDNGEKDKRGHFLVFLLFGISIIINVKVICDSRMNNVLNNIEMLDRVQITAHRGSSSVCPENTMIAFEQAVAEMADYIELDVRQTMDGELVVLHDYSLHRTTGQNLEVGNLTREQVQQLDAGSWKSPEYKDERIPTLEEVLSFAKGVVKLNIEVKVEEGDRQFAEKLVDMLEKHGMQESCIVSSFQYDVLREIKRLNPQIRTGYILSAAYGDFYSMKDVDFFSVNYGFVTKEMVEKAHNAGKEVHVWTVNGVNGIRRMLEAVVNNIITDKTVLVRELIYSRNADDNMLAMLQYVFDR